MGNKRQGAKRKKRRGRERRRKEAKTVRRDIVTEQNLKRK